MTMAQKKSSAVGKPTKENVATMDKMHEEHNKAINESLPNALAQVRSKDIMMVEYLPLLKRLALSGREGSMRDIYVSDLEDQSKQRQEMNDKLLQAIGTMKELKWHDEKLQTLNEAASFVSAVDQIMKEIKTVVKGKQ